MLNHQLGAPCEKQGLVKYHEGFRAEPGGLWSIPLLAAKGLPGAFSSLPHTQQSLRAWDLESRQFRLDLGSYYWLP